MSADAQLAGQDPESRLEHALELAYRYLARRDRTASEVSARLAKEGLEPPTAEAALQELQRQGYVDDVRYARRFAEDRRQLDGWGAERIERRLREVGVPEGVIQAELESRATDDELDGALAVLRRRLAAPPADDRERDRALRLLARRGYALELAYDAVRAYERGC